MKQLLCAESELRADGVYTSCEQSLNTVTPQKNCLCVFFLHNAPSTVNLYSTEIISNSHPRRNPNIKRQFSKFVDID